MGDNSTSQSLGVWLTFGGVLVNAAIAIWNANAANDIKKQQILLQQQQAVSEISLNSVKSEVERKDQDLSRLKFVKELLPDALSGEPTRSATFLTLVQLTLTEEEYRNLVVALQSSPNTALKEVGEQGAVVLQSRDYAEAAELVDLTQQIASDNKATRLQAMDALYAQYANNPKAVSAILSYLDSGRETPLHVQGRINAIYFLVRVRDAAWTGPLVERARDTLASVRRGAGDPSVGPPLGEQTIGQLSILEARLERIRASG